MKFATIATVPLLLATSSAAIVNNTVWAGALVKNAGVVLAVDGRVSVPAINTKNVKPNSLASGQAAVGIDTQDCAGYFLAGIDWRYTTKTGVNYTAFAQWGKTFKTLNIKVQQGDVVDIEVRATSTTSGVATIINASKGTHTNLTFSGQPSLCQATAEWIVTDPNNYNPQINTTSLVLANFQSEYFYSPTYTLSGRQGQPNTYALTPKKATLVNMVQNQRYLATANITSIPNDTYSVNVFYV